MRRFWPLDVDPGSLKIARTIAHQASQWPSLVARANISAKTDDSHSNLGWLSEEQALISHSIHARQRHQVAFSFTRQALLWLRDGQVSAEFAMQDQTQLTVTQWLEQEIKDAGLTTVCNVDRPYDLGDIASYDFKEHKHQTLALGAWFDFGNTSVTPVATRCWPHHFDVGSLFMLDDADPETARSIGIGLSPGDSSYQEPYFYCNPWPVSDTVTLPPAPSGTRWHTDGFTSLVIPASTMTEHQLIIDALVQSVQTVKSMLNG